MGCLLHVLDLPTGGLPAEAEVREGAKDMGDQGGSVTIDKALAASLSKRLGNPCPWAAALCQ